MRLCEVLELCTQGMYPEINYILDKNGNTFQEALLNNNFYEIGNW
jgi:hypothetical protein